MVKQILIYRITVAALINNNMEPESLRTRRNIQAESIVNNLRNKSATAATGRSKRLRKSQKKQLTRKASSESPEAEDYLTYNTRDGDTKKVQFIVSSPESPQDKGKNAGNGEGINISEVFLRTYKQLLHNKIITDNFYNNAVYERDTDSIFLFNDNEEDYFEIYSGNKAEREGKDLDNELMEPHAFETLVNDYRLNNLYC